MKALKNNLLFLSYIWKSDKWRIPLAVTVSLMQSFVSLLLEIYMIKYILDSFQIGRSFKDVLVVLTIMIGSALLSFYSPIGITTFMYRYPITNSNLH